MSEFDEAAEDLRAAFDDLRAAAGEQPRQRRALNAVLDGLYRVQEYRCGRAKVHKAAYFTHAEASHDGKVTLGPGSAAEVWSGHGMWSLTCGNV